MPIFVGIVQGLFELLGLIAFLAGYFSDIKWLMVTGGVLVVLDDIIELGMGILNPTFPILLAVVLALIFTPWYVGVFWSSAGFKVLNIPTSLMKVFAPRRLLSEAERRNFL